MTKQKSRIRAISILLLMASFLHLSAYATTRASDQICSYSAEGAACGNGKIAIVFSIEGTGFMNSLGASKIRIYEQSGRLAGYFLKSDEGMTATNKVSHGATMYFYGTSGVEYEIVVTVFAENDNGSDSRSITFYVMA